MTDPDGVQPSDDGEATATARRLVAAGVPILVCTAGVMPREMRHKWPDLPIHRKPVRATQLVETLSGLLEPVA